MRTSNWEVYGETYIDLQKDVGEMKSYGIGKKQRRSGKPFRFIRTNFNQNWGNKENICVYQLQLFGIEN